MRILKGGMKMRSKRRGIFAGLLLMASLAAREVPQPKYKVVTSLESVNSAADQGYRLLFPGVMRLEAMPPDTYRYMAVTVGKRPRPKEFLNYLNTQGALGYRFVYRLGVLEKAPHPRNYEYAFVNSGSGFWSLNPKLSTLPSLIAQGYRFVGVMHFDAILGQGTSEGLLERELDAKPGPTAAGWKIATPNTALARNVFKDLTEMAHQGYRYVGPYYLQGQYAVWMEACDECGGPYEYHELKTKELADLARVEQELNSQGGMGFRFVPDSPYFMQLLERPAGQKQTFLYRVLTKAQPGGSELEQMMNAADAEGYAPVDEVEVRDKFYVVVEKVLNVAEAR